MQTWADGMREQATGSSRRAAAGPSAGLPDGVRFDVETLLGRWSEIDETAERIRSRSYPLCKTRVPAICIWAR